MFNSERLEVMGRQPIVMRLRFPATPVFGKMRPHLRTTSSIIIVSLFFFYTLLLTNSRGDANREKHNKTV
jgi:hypothetical protein